MEHVLSDAFVFFFFNDTATTEIYTLSLHGRSSDLCDHRHGQGAGCSASPTLKTREERPMYTHTMQRHSDRTEPTGGDRKSTRLNSSHLVISYAVFCLQKIPSANTTPCTTTLTNT